MYHNNRIQIALFFQKLSVRPDKLFHSMDGIIGNLFDIAPINIPVPQDAPPEIPELQAVSSDNVYSLTISKVRIDFNLNNPYDDESNLRAENFKKVASDFIKFIINNQNIIRFGLVSTTIVNEQNPVDRIQKKYFKESFHKPNELSLRFNNQRARDKYILNDIVEISSVFANINNQNKQVVVVNRDINNNPIQNNSLKKDFVIDSFDSLYSELLVDKVKELI